MNIVFGEEIAEELRKKYFVLELETVENPFNEQIKAFCILPPESIALGDISDIDRLAKLHQYFIDSFNAKHYEQALEILPHLRGRFTGELDTFYSIIAEKMRMNNEF